MSSSSSSDDDISNTTTGTEAAAGAPHASSKERDSAFVVTSKTDTQHVAMLRLVVGLVLICSAVGVALSTNFYITDSENDQFKTQFKDDSEKVLQAIGSSLDKTLGLLDGLAVSLVSMARYGNQTWPCVSMPNLAVRMAKLLPLTDAVNINILPIVTPSTRAKWEDYTLHHGGWVDEAVAVQAKWEDYYGPVIYNGEHSHVIHGDFEDIPLNTTRNLLPLWQNFPVIANTTYTFNYDWLASSVADTYETCITKHKAVMSKPYMIPDPNNAAQVAEMEAWAEFFQAFLHPSEEAKEPISDLVYPIVDEIDRVVVAGEDDYDPAEHKVVGMLAASFYWRSYLKDILPKGSDGIQVLVENPCTASFAYEIRGPEVVYLGVNHQHEAAFTSMGKTQRLDALVGRLTSHGSVYSGAPLEEEYCPITLRVYPSARMKADFTTKDATIFTIATVAIFAFASLVFWLYDAKVERRQGRVLQTAVQSSAIVSSLFPTGVRDRLYPISGGTDDETGNGIRKSAFNGKDSSAMDSATDGLPIADLYPDTTVFFADIVGFTAWSSVRNPVQVFCLLETIYGAFDKIAKRRGVFKVETIGDSYVAVVGLPTPQKHHAVVMARFANDCRSKMLELVREMDETLGPGTADLSMRIGLNSGPTTAGVLRGEKSRFQLFGDTVNTAARMESNGKPGKIQVSQKTAELLKLAGKDHWLTLRDEQVLCKGKGTMTTYWCNPITLGGSASVVSTSEQSFDNVDDEVVAEEVPTSTKDVVAEKSNSAKTDALVAWCHGLFLTLLNDVVSHRDMTSAATGDRAEALDVADCKLGGAPLHEVREVLDLPNLSEPKGNANASSCGINAVAAAQLQHLIASIAGLYQNNPFHSFEHCCHVVMSTKKLLDRIYDNHKDDNDGPIKGCSESIAQNPLTRLAIVFAALIHDVDHPGVSNAQLVQERHVLAASYGGKSVAEQNSVVLSWQLLMQPEYQELRSFLFAKAEEMAQFRSILVNAVMATDLFDANLSSLREARWTKSFHGDSGAAGTIQDRASNLRATIIIDLIIQASDVSHTMQHFTVYKKWNMRLLTEMHQAYTNGRTTKDPLDGWYEGELWFFDNYVIPLAQKLRECGVFGVSCDEFLDYAKDNRLEWEAKGRDIVRDAAESFKHSSHKSIGAGECFEI